MKGYEKCGLAEPRLLPLLIPLPAPVIGMNDRPGAYMMNAVAGHRTGRTNAALALALPIEILPKRAPVAPRFSRTHITPFPIQRWILAVVAHDQNN